jgi:hypothetical protein
MRTFDRTTIFHTYCQGIWVKILREEEKPSIGGVPQSLRDRVGDVVTVLLQPRNPIIKKNSLARKLPKQKQ